MCLDANKGIHRKLLGKAFTDTNGLALREVVGAFTHKKAASPSFEVQLSKMECGQHQTLL